MKRLTKEEVFDIIETLNSEVIEFDRVRPHNKGEIRRPDSMPKNVFIEFVAESIEDEHQPGGDIELKIPSIGKTLVGQHDGVYWLE